MARTFTRELREPRAGEVAAFLARQGLRKLEPRANGELRFAPCPICHNRTQKGRYDETTRADVNPKTGLWRCFGCQAKGNWLTLTRAFGQELPRNDRYKDQRPEDTWAQRAFFESRSAKRRLVSGGHHPELLAYCLSRGIKPETLDRFRVSSRGDKTLRWPLYAWDAKAGKWAMANARMRVVIEREKSDTPDYFEVSGGPTSLPIGQHLVHARHGEQVFIWEGQWDAMTADQLGLGNSISVPNGAENIHVGALLRYIPDEWPIYLGMDMDEAGERAVEKFYAQCDPVRLRRLELPRNPINQKPYKDLNEWFTAKPDLTADEVMACSVGLGIPKAGAEQKRFKPLGELLKQASEAPKAQVIAQLPWPALNELMAGGLWGGETTGLLAPSGIGKTTFVVQLAVHAAGISGVPVGLVLLEGERAALLDSIRVAAAGWLQDGAQTEAGNQNIWLSDLEGPRVSWKDAVKELEQMAKAGAKLLVMDNFDHCASRSDMRKGSSEKVEALAAMIDIAHAYQAHALVVWQCGKIDRGQAINSGNQKGYAQTFHDSDNYINMNRMKVGDSDRLRLELEKVRRDGIESGKLHVWLQYVKQRRGYVQANDNVISLPAGASPGGLEF